MQEVWKDVVGYEGYYQVSNLGKVKSLSVFNRELKPYINKDGYFQVTLYKDKSRTLKRVHRIVAEAFIPNESGLPIINHKDENKLNNNAENLEWCTNQYNINYGSTRTKISQSHMKKLVQISPSGEIVNRFNSVSEARKKLNVGRSTITRWLLHDGKSKKYKNHTFKFVKE